MRKKKETAKGNINFAKTMICGTDKDFTDSDAILYKILNESGSVKGFLERVFGFLFRCTDFYRVNKDPADPFGLPKGSAKELLLRVFDDWSRTDSDEAHAERAYNKSKQANTPAQNKKFENTTSDREDPQSPLVDAGVYNGAQCDGYQWAQTHTDLDVRVQVKPEIRTAKDVSVVITSSNLSVKVGKGDGKRTVVEGDLSHEIRPGDSVWTLLPGQHIHVVLEKKTARWWESLLTNETAMDIGKFYRTRSLADLPESERDAVLNLLEKHHNQRSDSSTS